MRRLLLALLLVVALTSSAFAQIPPGGSGGGTTLTDSASLATALSDETGTGLAVFNTSPTLVTPVLGVAAATSLNKITITAPATGATLTVIDGKTFTVNKTLTLDGTDGTTMTFPSTSATLARTDAANTFTGVQTMTSPVFNTSATVNGTAISGFAFTVKGGDDNSLAINNDGSQFTTMNFYNNGTFKSSFYWDNTNELFVISPRNPSSLVFKNDGGVERMRLVTGGLITFGGVTSSFPAIKRSTTKIQVRLGDDSAAGTLEGKYNSSDGTPGATTTCTIVGLTSITVKDGLITSCS